MCPHVYVYSSNYGIHWRTQEKLTAKPEMIGKRGNGTNGYRAPAVNRARFRFGALQTWCSDGEFPVAISAVARLAYES